MVDKKNVKNSRRVIKESKPLLTVDWTSPTGLTPYYDYENKGYSVGIELGYESAGASSRFQRTAYPNEYIISGVKKIISYYNKQPPESDEDCLSLGAALNYHVPERPRAKIRVHVTIPEDSFELISENIEISTRATKEIVIDTLNINDKMKGIYNILLEYYEKEKNFKGKVYGIDFKDEAFNLINFVPSLATLIQANGYSFSDSISEIYKIGVDNDYDVKYVQAYKRESYQNLTVNFGQFKDSLPIKKKQTLYYVANADSIYGAYKSTPRMNWQEFINRFTIPGKDVRVEHGNTRTYSNEQSPSFEEQRAIANSNPVMTQEEREHQRGILGSPFSKETIAKSRSKATDNIEGGILNNLKSVENGLTGLESAYFQVLQRYQIAPLVRQAIICADPNGEIARRYAQMKQLLRDANSFVEDVVEILKIPAIELPDFLTTIDIMADIGLAIVSAVLDALYAALIQLLKDIIQMIVESCGNPDNMNFGSVNIRDAFTDWKSAGKVFGGRALNATIGGIQDGLFDTNNFELEASKKLIGNINTFLSNDQVDRMIQYGLFQPDGDVMKFFDSVSAITTPGELARLLFGKTEGDKTPTNVVTAISSLVDGSEEYSEDFKNLVSSPDKIADLFSSFGDLVDEDRFLEQIQRVQDVPYSPWTGLCESGDPNELRRKLLSNKGLTQEEIDKQLSDSAERRRKRIEQLSDLLEKDNILDGVLPPTYCSVDKDGKIVQGLTELDHPSFTMMMDRTLDTVYDGVYAQFNQEAEGFIPSLRKSVSEGFDEVPRVILKENYQQLADLNSDRDEDEEPLESLFAINPKFELYKGQGYQTKQPFPSPYSIFPDKDDYRVISSDGVIVEIDLENIKRFNNGVSPDGEAAFMQLSRKHDEDSWFTDNDKFSSRGRIPAIEFNILVPKTSNEIAPGLKDNLENFSLTSSTDSNLQYEDRKLKLKIPNLIIQQLAQSLSPLSPTNLSARSQIEAASGGQINLGPDSWYITYEPIVSSPTSLDNYKYSTTAILDDASILLYEEVVVSQINPKADNLINVLGISPAPNSLTSEETPQENIFNSLLANVFANGALLSLSDTTGPQDLKRMSFDNTVDGETLTPQRNPKLPEGAGTSYDILDHLREPQAQDLKTLYKEIFRDFMTSFSSEMSNSDFFKDEVISLMDLSPILTDESCRDPHLLQIEQLKEDIKKSYEEFKCVDSVLPDSDGLGTNRENALEASIISGTVKLTLRVYAIEYLLKSIFAFSEFNFGSVEDVDSLAVKILQDNIVKEIGARMYLTDFLNEVVKIYNRKAILSGSPQITPPPNEPLVSATNRGTIISPSAASALNSILKEELWNMMKKLDIVFGSPGVDNRIDSVVIDSMIPLTEVQSGSSEPVYNNDRKFASMLNEYEKQLLSAGLSERDIEEREEYYLGQNGVVATFEDVIRYNANPSLADQMGQQILHFPIYKSNPEQSLPQDISNWSTGSYVEPDNVQTPPPSNPSILFGSNSQVAIRCASLLKFLNPVPAKRADNQIQPSDQVESLLPQSGSEGPGSTNDIGKKTSWNSMVQPAGISPPEWENKGIRSTDLWRPNISFCELSGAISLLELINNPNSLQPGNAGQSFSIPIKATPGAGSDLYEYWTPSGGQPQPIYEVLELPSANKKIFQHNYTAQETGLGTNGYLDGKSNGGVGFYLRRTGLQTSEVSRVSSPDFDATTLSWNPSSTILSSVAEPLGVSTVGQLSNPNLLNAFAEYQRDSRMTNYSLYDATIPSLPGDISKEISYYKKFKKLINSDDRESYKFVERQFLQNRANWNLNRTEMIRLDKVAREFVDHGTWHGRTIPNYNDLDGIVENLHINTFFGPSKIDGDGNTRWLSADNNYEDSSKGGFTLVNIINQIARRLERLESLEDGFHTSAPPGIYATFQERSQVVTGPDTGGRAVTKVNSGNGLEPAYNDVDFGWPNTPPYRPGHTRWVPTLAWLNNRKKVRTTSFNPISTRRPSSGQLQRAIFSLDTGKTGLTDPLANNIFRYSRITQYYDKEENYQSLYFIFYQLDWWLSKLNAFMLLSDYFEDARYVKDYIGYLEEIRESAKGVRDSFVKDIQLRKEAREQVLESLGGLVSTRDLKGVPLTSYFGNGNIVLEKFVKIKDKDWDSIISEYNSQNKTNLVSKYESLRGIVSSGRDWTTQGVVNLEHFQRWIDSVSDAISSNSDLDVPEESDSPAPRPVVYTTSLPEKGCGQNLKNKIEIPIEIDPDKFKLSELFDELSYGIRLTVVSAESSRSGSEIEWVNNFVEKINELRSTSSSVPEFQDMVLRDKAYFHIETAPDLSIDGTGADIPKYYVTIPVTYSEIDIDLANTSISDIIGTTSVNNPLTGEVLVTRSRMEHLFSTNYETLKCNMLKSEEYKLIFKYLIPVDRMFSLASLYMQTYMTNFEEANRVFNGTKESLKMAFMSMINSGNYTYMDQVTNKGLANQDITQGLLSGIDLASLAWKFPLMVSKAFIEQVDPNIKLTRMIYEGAKKGLEFANANLNDNCEDITDYTKVLYPGFFATTSIFGLLPINLWGVPPFGIGYGPPITPLGLVYDGVFGIEDPLEPESTKRIRRAAAKCNPDVNRDFTLAEECSTDRDETLNREYLDICEEEE